MFQFPARGGGFAHVHMAVSDHHVISPSIRGKGWEGKHEQTMVAH